MDEGDLRGRRGDKWMPGPPRPGGGLWSTILLVIAALLALIAAILR